MNTDFSKFRFNGRNEFFDPPFNQNALFPLIVEAYRLGFARGCRAGADDVVRYMGFDEDARNVASRAFVDSWDAMRDAMPHDDSDTILTMCEVRPIMNLDWKSLF